MKTFLLTVYSILYPNLPIAELRTPFAPGLQVKPRERFVHDSTFSRLSAGGAPEPTRESYE